MSHPRFRGRVGALATLGLLLGSALGAPLAAQQAQPPAPTPVELASVAQTQDVFAAVAAHATPAVVSIQADAILLSKDHKPRIMRTLGTGFIVSADGYILTNSHVVGRSQKVTVTLPDRREFEGHVVGRDPTTDVALVKVTAHDLPTLPLGDDHALRVGDWVLTVGNPLGLSFTVTQGIVSAKGRGGRVAGSDDPYAIADFIQTDAPISPGNSGGPLVNLAGQVVGINTAMASTTGQSEGYGFAIPISLARHVMDQLIAHGSVERPLLGVSLAEVRMKDAQAAGLERAGVDAIRGARIRSLTVPDGPAAHAGLRPGDIVVSAAGHPIEHLATLQRVVRQFAPGDELALGVVRDGVLRTMRVQLGRAPEPADGTASATKAAPGTIAPRA